MTQHTTDASLIDAAPDLLDACRVVAAHLRGIRETKTTPRTVGDIVNEMLERKLCAAISKAEGRA